MNDGDQTALSPSRTDELAGQIWPLDEFGADEDRLADLATGVTSVGYIRAALRRGRRLWCATAVAGLLIGFGAYKAFPPAYQASTAILLASNLPGPPGEAVQDDAAFVVSRTVAGDALRKLGLQQSAASFTADYSATPVTDRVLSITVKATSSDAAVKEANAVATAFLTFQKNLLDAQGQSINASLQQEVTQAQQQLDSLNKSISQLTAQPRSSAQSARLGHLLTERDRESAALTQLKLSVPANQATMRISTATLVKGSQVLDPAVPLPEHSKRYLLLYAGGGLIAGLAIGLLIISVRALVSDKLRRRDDIARALGARVKLSVGKIRLGRARSSRGGLEAAQSTNIRRIVAHLEREVPPSWGGLASLALVPVDDVQVPAVCLASLALSCAQRGFQVVLADLCNGSPAARLLGVTDPGVQRVRAHDTHLVVAVTDPDDVAPVGPLSPRQRRAQAAAPLADACASADLLFTLSCLDPSVGADHLPGWARGAVAVVTAGRSSATRVHAVGEMTRLAEVNLISAVLVGADKTDESIGVTDPSGPSVSVGPDLG